MDKAIIDFFSEQKEKQLKGKLNAKMTQEEVEVVTQEVDDKFNMDNWLPDAASKAGQMTIASHPCTLSHPSSRHSKKGKTTSVISKSEKKADGFVRSGNVEVELDALGNAAVLPVYNFLTLVMSDGKTLIEHIEENTTLSKDLLKLESVPYDELREGFLAMKQSNDGLITNSKIKQVFFPLSEGYHLLSILTPSGIMYDLRNRIQSIRFGDKTKKAQEDKKNNEFNEGGFDEIFDLAAIEYGCSKPQNISVLINDCHGISFLLPSLPPEVSRQKTKLPTWNFFQNCLWAKQFQESLEALHKLLAVDVNNVDIRRGRDNIVLFIYDEIVRQVWQIRSHGSGWSQRERFDKLPKKQKVVLDDFFAMEREALPEVLDEFNGEIVRWILKAYEGIIGKKSLTLRDDEIQHFTKLIIKNREALL